VIISAFDIGKTNTAYAIMKDGILQSSGALTPLQSCSHDDLIAFSIYFEQWLEEQKLTNINSKEGWGLIERFMYRGPMSGKSIEICSWMIAIMIHIAHLKGFALYPITPAQWKNYLKKNHKDDTLEETLDRLFPNVATAHESDACGMCQYSWEIDCS